MAQSALAVAPRACNAALAARIAAPGGASWLRAARAPFFRLRADAGCPMRGIPGPGEKNPTALAELVESRGKLTARIRRTAPSSAAMSPLPDHPTPGVTADRFTQACEASALLVIP